MTSSATSTQLGRHVWGSIRDSVALLAARFPGRRPLSTGTPFASPQPPPHCSGSRLFHTARRLFQPLPPHISPRNVRKSCTSGGLLLLGLTSSPSSTGAVVTTCTAAADSALVGGSAPRATLTHLARQAWVQGSRYGPRGPKPAVAGKRASSTRSNHKGDGNETNMSTPRTNEPATQQQATPASPPPRSPKNTNHETLADSMSKYLHIPKMPHPPTKEELLAAASGFWQRLRILGTTTFFSLIILFINTVFAQETLAKWVGDYLTQSAGLTVVFESAIVPRWKDGVITFRNVFVSRRPGQTRSSVKKGSSNAAAEAAAARKDTIAGAEEEDDDGNYTQFDLTIDTVNVTLSFLKWWNGKGLLKDVEVKGVRGVVDRTSVRWDNDIGDPLSYRHEHNPGDFEIDHFKLEDLLVTVHQPNGFRPFSVSIFSCELPQLRKQWLFYDFLSASHMSGAYDGSLFTIHPRQIHGVPAGKDESSDPGVWKKFSRIRIDGLKIDHLNRGVDGPFGWIYEGNVDIVADIMFPADPAEGIGKVVADFYDKMEEAVTSNRYLRILENSSGRNRKPVIDILDNSTSGVFYSSADERVSATSSPLEEVISTPSPDPEPDTRPQPPEETPASYLIMDMRIHLNDVRAAVPLFNNPHISYVNQALVRPIVAYINAKRTYIPVTCRIVKRLSDFDGSWSVWDCGLMDDTSAEVYAAFARSVEDQQSRVRRFKRVGLWTVSLVVHALLAGVAGDLM
ncbi:hypothetical protein VTJ49DRAFT_1966 [Mycothermus thermophilus]|uniref:Mitochondrial distribution and morphology protein 31 n=1 Tax=Humicola insolens TaxID=85995 RepID=A0ABR3VP94_HUMIN